MKNRFTYICISLLAFLTGCISNDIPYPRIQAEITTFKVEGQSGEAKIDKETQTIEVPLLEATDISNLKIVEIEGTENVPLPFKAGEYINLEEPKTFTLKLYQEYKWTVSALQERTFEFKVENQIGNTIFNPADHTAVAYINKEYSQKRVKVIKLKLGPDGITTMTPTADQLVDFSRPQRVNVRFHKKVEEWTLSVAPSEFSILTKDANAWVTSAWLQGSGMEDGNSSFEYREKGEERWNLVPRTQIKGTASFYTQVKNLKPQTTYEYRAVDGEVKANIVEFTTGEMKSLPNGSFDDWFLLKPKNKVWNPWPENGLQFWDTGNTGATTLGDSNTVPTDDKWSGKPTGKAAKLESRFVGIGSIGKFAAGNLFVGDFVSVDGTNGILKFGKEFDSYPTHLKGYFKYKTAPIDNADDDHKYLMGRPDTCTIYIALGGWDKPVDIRTRPSTRKLFEKDDPHIIAYAEMNCGKDVDEYTAIDLPLEYRAVNRRPKYIIVVCSASKYGDFFTGGVGATLYVDEFKLTYE